MLSSEENGSKTYRNQDQNKIPLTRKKTYKILIFKDLAKIERFINTVGGPKKMIEFIADYDKQYKSGVNYSRSKLKGKSEVTITGLK
jgi:hypothetical protein